MRTRYFYLSNGNKVDLMEVGRIASFAISLRPMECDNVVDGYISALYEHMAMHRNDLLFNSYNLLISDINGANLISLNIKICLLERSFREDGANEASIKEYSTVFDKYHKILDLNNSKNNAKSR